MTHEEWLWFSPPKSREEEKRRVWPWMFAGAVVVALGVWLVCLGLEVAQRKDPVRTSLLRDLEAEYRTLGQQGAAIATFRGLGPEWDPEAAQAAYARSLTRLHIEAIEEGLTRLTRVQEHMLREHAEREGGHEE